MLEEKYEYTEKVLKKVKFKYDHDLIRAEINDHISDMLEFAPEMPEDEMKKYIEENMGNPDELGELLNKEHSPILGWIWRLSKYILTFIVIISIPWMLNLVLILGGTGINIISGYNYYDDNPVVVVEPNIKGKIDDITIYIDEVRRYNDNTVEICYRYIHNPLGKSQGWTFSFGWNSLKDEFGQTYGGSGGSSGGLISYCRERLEDFNPDAKKVMIDYDYYGRKFYAEIPIEWEE